MTTTNDLFLREMSTPDLVVLRHAFIADRDAANTSKQTKAFCLERLALIDDALKQRDLNPKGRV